MRVTPRDIRLVKDLALSHAMSRDQIIALNYFGSVTRTNTRLRALRGLGLVRILETPFFGQHLHAAGARAPLVAGERISAMLDGRGPSPRFLQHALVVTNARIKLLKEGATGWRFEQQVRTGFTFAGREYEVRPDGLATFSKGLVAVEVDMGRVAPAKVREKFRACDAFISSGESLRSWQSSTFTVLVLTSGPGRAASLRRLVTPEAQFRFRCETFDAFGVSAPGAWS